MARLTIEDRMVGYQEDAEKKIFNALKAKFFHQDDKMIKQLMDIIVEGIMDNGEYAMEFANKYLEKIEIFALKEDTEMFEQAYDASF